MLKMPKVNVAVEFPSMRLFNEWMQKHQQNMEQKKFLGQNSKESHSARVVLPLHSLSSAVTVG